MKRQSTHQQASNPCGCIAGGWIRARDHRRTLDQGFFKGASTLRDHRMPETYVHADQPVAGGYAKIFVLRTPESSDLSNNQYSTRIWQAFQKPDLNTFESARFSLNKENDLNALAMPYLVFAPQRVYRAQVRPPLGLQDFQKLAGTSCCTDRLSRSQERGRQRLQAAIRIGCRRIRHFLRDCLLACLDEASSPKTSPRTIQ